MSKPVNPKKKWKKPEVDAKKEESRPGPMVGGYDHLLRKGPSEREYQNRFRKF